MLSQETSRWLAHSWLRLNFLWKNHLNSLCDYFLCLLNFWFKDYSFRFNSTSISLFAIFLYYFELSFYLFKFLHWKLFADEIHEILIDFGRYWWFRTSWRSRILSFGKQSWTCWFPFIFTAILIIIILSDSLFFGCKLCCLVQTFLMGRYVFLSSLEWYCLRHIWIAVWHFSKR